MVEHNLRRLELCDSENKIQKKIEIFFLTQSVNEKGKIKKKLTTPSPESNTIPVVRPEAYSDNTA